MPSPDDVLRIHHAFCAGDLQALLAAVEDPADVPNGVMPLAVGNCLVYAVYHSPLPFIRTLLELGADPNPPDDLGFPPLIAAITCLRSHPGSPARADALEVLELLLQAGSNADQRGINDYTPLHMAVAERSRAAVELLLAHGADPTLATRIDDYETPREMAQRSGQDELVQVLAEGEMRRRPTA